MTVKECVLNILKNKPHLSNQEIANEVRKKLNSKTTAQNISWYKSELVKKNKITEKDMSKDGKNKGIEKYKGCYIKGTQGGVLAILGPEARNIVQTLYKSKKRGMLCEYKECTNKEQELEACHVGKERKEILEDALKKSKGKKGYDVYKVFQIYKEKHHPKSTPIIRFLCREHHKMLDKNKTINDKDRFIEKYLKKVK